MLDTTINIVVAFKPAILAVIILLGLVKSLLFLLPLRRHYYYHHLFYYSHASRVHSRRKKQKMIQNFLSLVLMLFCAVYILSSVLF